MFINVIYCARATVLNFPIDRNTKIHKILPVFIAISWKKPLHDEIIFKKRKRLPSAW